MPETKNYYELLSVPVPENIVFSYKTDDGKELKNYPAQYAIDLLNATLGLGNWVSNEEILRLEVIGKSWLVAMRVEIAGTKEFSANGYGSEYAKDLDVALKSARTKAFKNACRYLGIGKELYYDVDVETPTEEIKEETPIELSNIMDAINKAETIEQLDDLLPQVEAVNGEKLKAILIKAYNAQKIKLSN